MVRLLNSAKPDVRLAIAGIAVESFSTAGIAIVKLFTVVIPHFRFP